MGNYSLFDVLGPIMIGPSSSHTAGACRISRWAAKICGNDFVDVVFYLHGSFAKTYLGHGTDKALLAGALGFDVDDVKLKDSFEIAKQRGITFSFKEKDLGLERHPNSVEIVMSYENGRKASVIGSSIGGGNIRINEVDGVELTTSGNFPVIILKYEEQKGIIAFVSTVLSEKEYNIEKMTTHKDENDFVTLMVEMTEEVEEDVLDFILKDKRFKISKYLPKGY